jgi:GNAT superfamily N-acetyltransferase
MRPLGPDDAAAFVDLYMKAPAKDRATRFCGVVSEDFVRSYAERAMSSATELLGLFAEGRLCAAAEVYFDKQEAEMAFLVAPDAQCKGMGSMLMAAALSVAHERGATSALVMSSPTNVAMHRVALVNGLTRKSSDMEWCAAVEIDQECDTHFPSVYQLRQPD